MERFHVELKSSTFVVKGKAQITVSPDRAQQYTSDPDNFQSLDF